jgi:O-antigen/teichoic acid export membrane protein
VILIVGHVVAAALAPVTSLLVMTGHEVSAATAHIVTAILSAVLIAAVTPTLGIMGAAVASTMGLSPMQIALFVLVRRKLHISTPVFGFLNVSGRP